MKVTTGAEAAPPAADFTVIDSGGMEYVFAGTPALKGTGTTSCPATRFPRETVVPDMNAVSSGGATLSLELAVIVMLLFNLL